MMKTYLIASIVVLCACLVLGKPAASGPKVSSQDISTSINRLIEKLRQDKAAVDRDQNELVKIVLAFSGKLHELQQGIQHLDNEAQQDKTAEKREDILSGPGITASSSSDGDVPHVVQQVVVKAPEPQDQKPAKIDKTKLLKLLLAALEKGNKGKGKPNKGGKNDKPKKGKKLEGSKTGDESVLERLNKRGHYYDAELDDGFDMFKKRNQKQEPVSDEIQHLLNLLDAKDGN